jgi:hypothetical protein
MIDIRQPLESPEFIQVMRSIVIPQQSRLTPTALIVVVLHRSRCEPSDEVRCRLVRLLRSEVPPGNSPIIDAKVQWIERQRARESMLLDPSLGKVKGAKDACREIPFCAIKHLDPFGFDHGSTSR